MENTRIPKPASGLKPPTKVNHPSVGNNKTGLKPLTAILENKISKTASASTSSDQKSDVNVPVRPVNALRRRSKSVTDLRPAKLKPNTALRPTTKTNVVNDKTTSIRTGQKRPLNKNGDEVKPKVQKVKIPDWDYKSRFLELQKKHGLLVDEHKSYKSKLSDLNTMEEENERLREDNTNKQQTIDSLQIKQEIMRKQIKALETENVSLKNELSQSENSYETVKKQFESLTEEHNAYLIKFNCLQKAHSEIQADLQELSVKCQHLESLVKNLKESIEEHESLRRILHNNIQDLKGNIRVFCRVRPPLDDEDSKLLCSIHFPDENSLEIRKSRESVSTISGKPTDLKQEFNFDKVFSPEATQAEVFEELSQLVQSALDGFHVCVFAYGQTGSGKTFTMQGSPQDDGMIPRTISKIFERIEKLKLSGWTYKVTASFLEIYNENVRDLLDPNSSYNYEIRFNEGRGVTVSNLKIMSIAAVSEMKKMMDEAHKNRAVAATDFNLHSSRSHAITKIHLKGYNEESKITYKGSINLVDLAGSESAKTSSADRLTETKNINKSLSTLGGVMLALHNKDSHVPYRNSKLTFLLQSCLGGNSKTLMFVNISPFEECYGESINALRFAAKVKDIKTHARKNKGYFNIPSLQTSKSTL